MQLKRYQPFLIVAGTCAILFLFGMNLMELNIELTGSILLMASVASILLFVVRKYFASRPSINRLIEKLFTNPLILLSAAGLLFLIGTLETFPDYLVLTILFLELFVFVLLLATYNYFDIPTWRHDSATKVRTLSKEVVWPLIFGVAFFFFCLAVLEDEPLSNFFTFIVAVISIGFGIVWLLKQIRSIITLKNEKTKTELMHLKSQVNPHFFFNTLNNLYGLVGKDAEKAQELILKLSDMMRYSIYEGEKETVTLEDEVDYLQNYIDLHKMRYHKEINVDFSTDIHRQGIRVMPLLFIILLENAFKHGVENLTEKAYVKVALYSDGNAINFEVENNFDSEEVSKTAGIGLANLKRRLELAYPKKHKFEVSANEEVYKTKLSLMLR